MISNSWVIVIGVGVGAGGGTGVGATAHAAPARDVIIPMRQSDVALRPLYRVGGLGQDRLSPDTAAEGIMPEPSRRRLYLGTPAWA